ncbi:MAG: CDP-diacylglycerol--glycerol-3-phosphate 3-phosphatidyltransferase [Calditrichia bacterium]|nr:CDP-diacylglycerol--glycerol-3-phosphate 3-phosphatidyltransferase [Calditrichia bacterium]
MKLTIPNQLTILRILLTPLFLYLFVQESVNQQLAGTIVFFIASATDWYDGYIARKLNIVSRWGQFMDPLADKILISSAFIILAYLKILFWWMVWIIVIRDFLITFLRIFALNMGKSVVTSTFAKWKTFSQMAILIIVLLFINLMNYEIFPALNKPLLYNHWISISMIIVTFITTFSGIQYMIENRLHLYEIYRRILGRFIH